MNQSTYCLLENYMTACMEDSAHDREHIYRVLYHALDIAKTGSGVDYDVLIAADFYHCLHREAQTAYENGRDELHKRID